MLRQQGKKVVHLGFGESPFDVAIPIQKALAKACVHTHYLPGGGLHELREAIASHYQKQFKYNVEGSDVYVAPGSKEALFQLLYLIDGPLFLPAPSWVSYEPQAKLLGKEVVKMPTTFENNYCLQAEVLKKHCAKYPKNLQKILMINSPNNPTGMVYRQENFTQLAKVCQENNIIVLSDEIYAGIEFSDTPHASMVYAYPSKTIVTSGISKLFSAGGYRLGFSLIPKQLASLKKALEILISETYSCVSTPIAYAALEAYLSYDEMLPYLKQCNLRHQWAAEYLTQAFRELGLRVNKAQGAFYLLPDFSPFKDKLKKRGIFDDVSLCNALLENVQVAALPGSEFGIDPHLLSMRIATVDYNGAKALLAKDISDECFDCLRLGVSQLKHFISEL